MKKLTCLSVALFGLAVCPMAQADINDDLQNICTIVKNDDKSELRKKLKKVQDEYNMRLGDIYSGISCGGISLIRYAMENGAVEAGTFMIKKMSKSELTTAEQDGQMLQEWAQSKGYMDGPIGQELLARIN